MSSNVPQKLLELLNRDRRYTLDAYQFVREALSYAQDVLNLGRRSEVKQEEPPAEEAEHHLTGQQLCEAIRKYALEQYGYMAQFVLNSWGVRSTSDFGDIVFNLIDIEFMKQSPTDRREDFDVVYDFDQAFRKQFEFSVHE